MLSVIVSKDEMIERKCVVIRGALLALHNHEGEMSKNQVLELCRNIIVDLIDILEMLDE